VNCIYCPFIYNGPAISKGCIIFREWECSDTRVYNALRTNLLAGDIEERALLVGALASLRATSAATASAHALADTAAVLLIGAAAGVGSRAATNLAASQLAASLAAGARAGGAAALALL
jgi:hypothetical protein